MRPRSLTISGLTSFANRVSIDFDDANLFALVGPTGAGKSSVVDAMILALYGRIPRLHGSEIAPAISSVASECTVGLDFTVRGQPHRAVRTIRRTKTGASTLEAALDQLDADGEAVTTLAGTAEDVTAEVEKLLGLSFEEFTRAVVLPQGKFATVLTAKPGERQQLLARLLGTGIYDRVKQRAGVHGRAAQERAEQIAHQIAQLGAADQAEIERLRQQVTRLDDLIAALTEDAQQLVDIRERFREATSTAKTLKERLDRLNAIGPPPVEVEQLGDQMAQAAAEEEKARAASRTADDRLRVAEEAAGDPERLEQLTVLIAAHGRTQELTAAVTETEAVPQRLADEITRLTQELATAQATAAQAAETQARLHREHAAVQAADGLAPGDPCPVCAATMDEEAPAFRPEAADAQAAIADVGRVATEAVHLVASVETRLDRARNDRDQAVTAREQAVHRLQAHLEELRGQPDPATAAQEAAEIRRHNAEIAGLRKESRQAREDLERAGTARRRLAEQATGLQQRLDRLRLAVADLDPPSMTGEVVDDWMSLHDWARQRLPAATAAVADAAQAAAAIQAEGTRLREAMERACAAAGVPEGSADPRDRAVQARADTAAEATRQSKLAEMADRMQAEEAEARQQAVVGGELARLLRSDQFQKWLLDEATRALVAGASRQLRDLSSGRYELTLDGRGAIGVTDLSSAGATRSVRTLSGGETFLASLALALSLAEQIAMTAAGPVALESLFVDEGFGALDPETLDVAAGAIEQLGAGDRTVGVITHVTEMADRLPTRFVVRRTAAGSRVDRIDV